MTARSRRKPRAMPALHLLAVGMLGGCGAASTRWTPEGELQYLTAGQDPRAELTAIASSQERSGWRLLRRLDEDGVSIGLFRQPWPDRYRIRVLTPVGIAGSFETDVSSEAPWIEVAERSANGLRRITLLLPAEDRWHGVNLWLDAQGRLGDAPEVGTTQSLLPRGWIFRQ